MNNDLLMQRTGEGTSRRMLTIRLPDGAFVAALSCTTKQSAAGNSSGFWVQFVSRNELSSEHIEHISVLLAQETEKALKHTLSDQK